VLWQVHIGGFRIGHHALVLPLWVLMFVCFGSRWAWRQIRNPLQLTHYLNLVSGLTLTVSLVRLGVNQITVRSENVDKARVLLASEAEITLHPEQRLDIYYLVLDGYGRHDVLRDLYHFDNSAFLTALTERGFFVAEQSRSNYIQTDLFMASALNMTYLTELASASADRTQLKYLMAHNRVFALLQQQGYQVVTVDTVTKSSQTQSTGALAPLNTYESMLVHNSVLLVLIEENLLKLSGSGYDAHRQYTRHAFEALRTTIPASPSPKLVFFYVMAPHPPFVFDRDGNPVTPNAPYVGGLDGDEYPDSIESYLSGYVEQLRYINHLTLTAIDTILAQSSSPPIIIIQSDHGPGALLRWDSIEASCLWERVSNLTAYYLPLLEYPPAYSSITPVNTFRMIFDGYFGAQFGMLEDRSYFSSRLRPYEWTDVTELSKISCVYP